MKKRKKLTRQSVPLITRQIDWREELINFAKDETDERRKRFWLVFARASQSFIADDMDDMERALRNILGRTLAFELLEKAKQ